MDRKHCILLYSNHSQASIDLLTYINDLPLDFPKITGMTMICVDHDQFKDTLQKNGIDYVPTLLVEYYQRGRRATPDQTKQKLERDYIYMWIDQVMKAIQFPQVPDVRQPVGQDRGGHRRTEFPVRHTGPSQHDSTTMGSEEAREDVPQIQKKDKVDVTSLAMQMAKERDSYISDTTPSHKKG